MCQYGIFPVGAFALLGTLFHRRFSINAALIEDPSGKKQSLITIYQMLIIRHELIFIFPILRLRIISSQFYQYNIRLKIL